MKKTLEYLQSRPLLTGLLGIVISFTAVKTLSGPKGTVFGMLVLRILLTCTCAFFLYLISGEKVFRASDGNVGFALKRMRGFLIFAALFGCFGLLPIITSKQALAEHWLRELVLSIVMFLFVGLFEEFCFRAIFHDMLLYRFRDKKNVFVWIAVLSSLVFGAVHVLGTNIDSGLAFAQAALKTVSTALIGFALLVVYWKTHNLWGIALVHGLNDTLMSILTALFDSNSDLGNYVMAGEEGVAAVIVYVFQTVVNLILVLLLCKKVFKTIDFEQIRREW